LQRRSLQVARETENYWHTRIFWESSYNSKYNMHSEA
jgi:hypothetical protein